MAEALNLPASCLVVLVGPGASGKSTWAAAHFPADAIVSSDRLRAVVGSAEDDLTASVDAFELLEQIVRRRVARRLTTVIDTLGLDIDRRQRWLALAREHGLPCVAVAFDTTPAECRERNRNRSRPTYSPRSCVRGGRFATAWPWRGTTASSPRSPSGLFPSRSSRHRQRPGARRSDRRICASGCTSGRTRFPGGAAATADQLRSIGAATEDAGFDAIYVMDHFRQIPQVGRAWDDFLESYTTLGYLGELAEAGAQEVMVRLADLDGPAALEPIAKVIAAFR